jgi:peptide/nickel transport system permease protein
LAAGLPWLSAEREGRVLGYAYAGAFRPRPAYRFAVENSIYVDAGAQGQGIGVLLLAELIARCEDAGARQMLAVIGDSANAGSIGLHQALGFRRVGVITAVGFKHGRWVDTVITRFIDVIAGFPFLLFAISLASIVSVTPLHIGPFTLRQGVPIVVLVIGIFSWATVARIVRGQVIAIRHREYVEAARALGAGGMRIIWRHLLPNVVGTVIVNATLTISAAILTETALSFVGVGVQPPDTSLGLLVSQYQSASQTRPWLFWWPGLCIVAIALTVNFIGDGLRDAFDPKQTRVRA